MLMQAFLQGGLGADSGPRIPTSSGQTLPHNLRIISNFFRTAPDGSVRAFSQPIVHERYVYLMYLYCFLFYSTFSNAYMQSMSSY